MALKATILIFKAIGNVVKIVCNAAVELGKKVFEVVKDAFNWVKDKVVVAYNVVAAKLSEIYEIGECLIFTDLLTFFLIF